MNHRFMFAIYILVRPHPHIYPEAFTRERSNDEDNPCHPPSRHHRDRLRSQRRPSWRSSRRSSRGSSWRSRTKVRWWFKTNLLRWLSTNLCWWICPRLRRRHVKIWFNSLCVVLIVNMSGQLVRVLTTASLTTALTPRGRTPALMAAPPPSGGPGVTAGVPRRTESAVMDQLRHSTETSPLLPALMEAIPSKKTFHICRQGRSPSSSLGNSQMEKELNTTIYS